MTLSITAGFSAAHLYRQKNWDEKTNQEVFGSCYSQWGHGHNYHIEVGFADPGSDFGRSALKSLVLSLASELDNRHLNYEISEFLEKNPTTENLIFYFEKKIQGSSVNPKPLLRFIKVYEMDSLGSEFYYD